MFSWCMWGERKDRPWISDEDKTKMLIHVLLTFSFFSFFLFLWNLLELNRFLREQKHTFINNCVGSGVGLTTNFLLRSVTEIFIWLAKGLMLTTTEEGNCLQSIHCKRFTSRRSERNWICSIYKITLCYNHTRLYVLAWINKVTALL